MGPEKKLPQSARLSAGGSAKAIWAMPKCLYANCIGASLTDRREICSAGEPTNICHNVMMSRMAPLGHQHPNMSKGATTLVGLHLKMREGGAVWARVTNWAKPCLMLPQTGVTQHW